MRTGLTKREKTTAIYFDEYGSMIEVQTHNTDLKKRLTAFAKEYPQCCRQIDDDEQGGLTFELEKGRLSLRSYPGALCNENNLLTQTVPAAKSGNPIPPARPSTENVGGLFHPIHPIKKEVMHYDKTENRPRTESRARRQ